MHTSRFSKLIPWLFAGPALLAMALFYVYPTIVTVFLSFTRGTITTPAKEFVGLDNYRILLTEDRFFLSFEDGAFSGALVNSLAWLILFPTAVVLIGLLVAVLSDKVKYEAIIKSIMFMPMAISATAAAVIFRLLYNQNPNLGSLNAFLTTVFPDFQPVAFLGSVDVANLAVIFAGVWISTGLSVIVLSAAYKAIPAEIHEAGRDRWRQCLATVLARLRAHAQRTNDLHRRHHDHQCAKDDRPGAGDDEGRATRGDAHHWLHRISGRLSTTIGSGYGSAVAVILFLLVTPFIIYQLRQVRREL